MTERAPALLLPAWVAQVALVALLGGCASKPQGTVVLLPDGQSRDTAVLVKQDGGELLLDKPYAAAQLTSRGPAAQQSSAEQVQAQFGAALAARPLPPASFTLYFVEGRNEFTAESRRDFDAVFTEIARRPVPDLVVIGHTDTVGSATFNDNLSRQRADVVRNALVARGIAAERIVVVGRGEREPVVPTADNVAEPRNRRVEIQVR
jgi:outer membrane protein OmpA-like peptidoglycan-associated protein